MTLIEMSLTGSAMIVLIIVLRAFLMNHLPKRTFVCLWVLALIRLMLPFSIPVHMPGHAPSTMPVAVTQVGAFARQNLPVNAWPGAAAPEQPSSITQAQPMPVALSRIQSGPLPAKQVDWLAVVYFTGAAFVGLYLLSAYVLLRREFKKSRELTGGPAVGFVRAHNLRRDVRVLMSGRIQSPITYGLIRPCVLLPESMADDPAQLPYVLTHELTHIKRLDAPMKLVFAVCLCLHWFNPLVWAMYILYNRDVELACDERVVRTLGTAQRARYAQLLLHMQEGRNRLTPLCNSFSRYSLKERIVSISKYKKTSALMMTLALVLVASIATGFATRTEQAPVDPPVTTGQPAAIEEMEGFDPGTDIGALFEGYEPFGAMLVTNDPDSPMGWSNVARVAALFSERINESTVPGVEPLAEGDSWQLYSTDVGDDIFMLRYIRAGEAAPIESLIQLIGDDTLEPYHLLVAPGETITLPKPGELLATGSYPVNLESTTQLVSRELRRRELLRDVLPWDRELPWSVSIHVLPPDRATDYGETYATARRTHSDVLRLEITRYEESSLPEQIYVGVMADGGIAVLSFTTEQQAQLLALPWEKSGTIELSGTVNHPEYTPALSPDEASISIDDIDALLANQLYDGWIEGIAPLRDDDNWRLYGTKENDVYLLQISHAGNAVENIYLRRESDVFLRHEASSFPAISALLAGRESERYDDVVWEDAPFVDIPQPEELAIEPNYAPLATPGAAWLDQKWDEIHYKKPDPRVTMLMNLDWQNMSVAAFNQEVRRAIDTTLDDLPLDWRDLYGTYEDSTVADFILGPMKRAMTELGIWDDQDNSQWNPGDPHGSSAFVLNPSLEAYQINAPYVQVDYLLTFDTPQPDGITVGEREAMLAAYQERMNIWFSQFDLNELVQGDLLPLIRAERDRLTHEFSTPKLRIRAINFHGRYFDGTKTYETPGSFADNMENPPNEPPVDDPNIVEIHYSNLTNIRVGTVYRDIYDEDSGETQREHTDYFVSMGGQDQPWHRDGWRDPATGLSIKFFPDLGWPLISPDNGETWWREIIPDDSSPDGSVYFDCAINTTGSQDLINWTLWHSPTSGWRISGS